MATTHAWHEMTHDMHDVAAITQAEPARQAYLVLWVALHRRCPWWSASTSSIGFMNVNWEAYLATWVNDIVPGSAADAMMMRRRRRARGGRAASRWRRGSAVYVIAALAGRHHRQPDLRGRRTPTSRCVTSGCWSVPSRWPGWRRPTTATEIGGGSLVDRSARCAAPCSSSASHAAALASDGIRQSPRGDMVPPALTFGPVRQRRALELAGEEPLHEDLEPVPDRPPGRRPAPLLREARRPVPRRRVAPGVPGQERDLAAAGSRGGARGRA